ncbi:transcriptional regulator BetI [Celerinatantimonas sp. MCCC 1A17872]|uniref:transcriptional regulator BetI n=1 Tax=Celerinatantimonas sp. MCCC 1A17872 TaxID=3177514 RepID=UPI0038C33B85
MPKVGMPEIRRPQLINATMEVIDDVGLAGASVSLISRKAGVSAGIINHYFGGKHGLLEATMRSVLKRLGAGIVARLRQIPSDQVLERIRAIVEGNFDPHQTESKVVKTWLAFWTQSMHDHDLYRLQRVNERRLHSHLRGELKKVLSAQRAEFVAQGVAALIDGLWLRGALAPEGIQSQKAIELIRDYLAREIELAEVS